jgi:pimeloyl-ACP methyl ester carboxylesterase
VLVERRASAPMIDLTMLARPGMRIACVLTLVICTGTSAGGPIAASITVPTLLLYGSDDSLVPIEHGQQLAAGIRNSELVVFEVHGTVSSPSSRNARRVT